MFQSQKNIENRIDNYGKNIASKAITAGSSTASAMGISNSAMPTYLQLNLQRAKKKGFYDMKPFFEHSSKIRFSKTGSWYLIIPLRRKVNSMTSTLYGQARAIELNSGKTMATAFIGNLYGKQAVSPVTSLVNSKAGTSGNLTRVANGGKSKYYAFRTVSAKSKPSSWIIGRQYVNHDDMSKTMIDNIVRAIKWQLRHPNS